MTPELWMIVNEYREKGIQISDEDAETVYKFCLLKMNVAGIQNKEEYLPLLYSDEIRNHLLAVAINATTTLRMMGRR